MKQVISAQNIEKTYIRGSETVHALNRVSFSITPGMTAVTGPSGSGKTTLMHIIGCLDRPTAGSISIGGRQLENLPESDILSIRREKIGFIFQQFYLMPGLTVEQNVALPLLFSRKKKPREEVQHVLDAVGLARRGNHLPRQLSGGEMQRVAIGRAMINNPEIILADEPTANLDSKNAENIFSLLQNLTRSGITVVMVTHNRNLADRADTTMHLEDGSIVNG